MRFIIALMLMLYTTIASAQVAQISPAGTTVYSRQKNTLAPSKKKLPTPSAKNIIIDNKAEMVSNDAETAAKMKDNPVMKTLRGSLRDIGDQKVARNIMIVHEVSGYKFDDEQLNKYFERLQENREYQRNLQKIMNNLQNDKFHDAKNREIIRILDEAGERIYNLMAY